MYQQVGAGKKKQGIFRCPVRNISKTVSISQAQERQGEKGVKRPT